MKTKILLLFIFLILFTINLRAQFKDYTVKGGIQYNQLYTFSEYSNRYSFLGRGYVAFEITNVFAVEIGGGYGQYKTNDDVHTPLVSTSSNHLVKTDIIPVDARLRIAPIPSINWNPYFYLGTGFMKYNVKEVPDDIPIIDYSSKAHGWTQIITLGIGTETRLSSYTMLDISLGATYPFTDQLNNFIDGSWQDAYANLSIGLTFAGNNLVAQSP